MGCFIVPATEAVVTTVVTKVVEKKEKKEGVEFDHAKFSSKLKNLNGLLWGGSALLAFEHVWHGEVQPFFPFLPHPQRCNFERYCSSSRTRHKVRS